VVRFPAGARDISLLRNVQTNSGSHPASYSIGTGGGGVISTGVKLPRREANTDPINAEVKNEWSYASTSPTRLISSLEISNQNILYVSESQTFDTADRYSYVPAY
jgi:hypothetical protein